MPKGGSHLKLRAKLVTLASGIALAAGAVVAFAGPAAAVTDVRMCVTDLAGTTQCAFENGIGVNITMTTTGGTDWDAPETATHEIEVANSGNKYCMTVASGNTVQVQTCAGDSQQEWIVKAATGEASGDFIYESEGVTGDCLNDHYQLNPSQLNVAPCTNNNPDEEFILSSSS
jgi:hypothetical protein